MFLNLNNRNLMFPNMFETNTHKTGSNKNLSWIRRTAYNVSVRRRRKFTNDGSFISLFHMRLCQLLSPAFVHIYHSALPNISFLVSSDSVSNFDCLLCAAYVFVDNSFIIVLRSVFYHQPKFFVNRQFKHKILQYHFSSFIFK